MMILRTLLLIFLFLLIGTGARAAATSQPSEKDTDWYQIDVLIIRLLDKTNDSAETWPPLAEHRYPLDAVKLYTVQQYTVDRQFLPKPPISRVRTQSTAIDQATYAPSARRMPHDRIPNIATQPFIQLPASAGLLNREAATIKRSRDYRLLYQTSWRMPLSPDNKPVHIYIAAGQQVGNDSELEGIITLSARRFMHAEPQLWLNRLNPILPTEQLLLGNKLLASPSPSAQPPPLASSAKDYLSMPIGIQYTGNFLMTESRRLKSDAINYFDSPSLAVLMTITPYELPGKSMSQKNID